MFIGPGTRLLLGHNEEGVLGKANGNGTGGFVG